jgi:hypothetical protein
MNKVVLDLKQLLQIEIILVAENKKKVVLQKIEK